MLLMLLVYLLRLLLLLLTVGRHPLLVNLLLVVDLLVLTYQFV